MTGFLRLLARNRLALAGAIVMALVFLLALVTPLLPLADPDVTDTANRFRLPFSKGALLGTDHLGRDLLSRLLWGTRLSLAVGFAAAIVAATIGAAIGIISGYYGERVDNIIMRGVDMLMAFPYILLALAIVAALGPGLLNALVAVAAVNVPFFARNIRGITVGLAHKEFVDAARLAGLTNARIILTEILPNVIPVIVIAMSTTIGWMILETAGLSFLGLGSQPPQADLGSMLGEARSALITNPHTSIVPGVMILIIVMSINLLGDGVRDALDPRLKSGALSRPMAATRVDRREPVPDATGAGLLEVQNLQTQFHVRDRNYRAVGGVSLHVKPGECLGIIGESGSGKSVTALSVMGLVASPPGVIAGGAVRYDGEDLIGAPYRRLREMRGRNVAYIFQDPLATLHPLYRVGDQLIEAIRAHRPIGKAEGHAKAIELLKAVRIPNPEKRVSDYPHEMSGGMRQRVGIAMALANDPDIIIADEPTTALDVTVQAQILSLLDDLRRSRGLAIVFITHDFGVVAQLCDRVAVMYAGRIVEEGPTRGILETPLHPYTARLMACVPELGGGKRRLEAIPGLPPVVDKLPAGCSFADRCTKAREDCRTGEIHLEREGARAVRCIHPETPLREAAE
ncbi:ABC transporter permease subunit [Sulfitobacter sp. BDSS02]|nr:ABC transporter permease subunit [Sulfitobacter sp. BDSS02]MBR9848905.1 dipeptide/oligopeptide/nickel ABC transporter permease/ATP-binding protein [Paracoccaceae bacterium]